MHRKFHRIKERYDDFERSLLRKGSLVAKDTDIGYWSVSHLPSAFDFFSRFNIKYYNSFIDLGSGDGRITLLASLFGLNSFGIEFDQKLLNESIQIKNKLALDEFRNVTFINDDFDGMDISAFDLVFINPDKPFYRGLEEKLRKELTGKLIVMSWEFRPQRLKKVHEEIIYGEKFSVYENPLG